MRIESNVIFPQFRTEQAILTVKNDWNSLNDDNDQQEHVFYDFGARTVPQLLAGRDDRLYDPGYANPEQVDPSIGRAIPCRWHDARMMHHAWELANPIPDRDMADYLYRMTERVLVHGHVPSTFIPYQHVEYAARRLRHLPRPPSRLPL
jgi:hypothetical protein